MRPNRVDTDPSLGKLRPHEDRSRPLLRGARPAGARRAGQAGRGRGLPRALDLRPLPPVERRAGPQPVRVVGDRRDRRRRPSLPVTTGGDLPHHPHPPGRHRAGRGHQRRPARGALRPRRRAAARRSTSTSSATRWPEADVRLEMLEEAVEVIRHAVAGRRSRATAGATTASRTRASTTCPDAPPPVLVSGLRPEGDRSSRPASATATARRRPTPSSIGLYRSGGGTGPVHAGTKVCFGHDERRRAGPATGSGRTRGCPASSRRSCRRRRTSSRPASS